MVGAGLAGLAAARTLTDHGCDVTVLEYAARTDRLSERERLHLLGVLERLGKTPATRTARVVDQEIKAVRAARRHGGRRRA